MKFNKSNLYLYIFSIFVLLIIFGYIAFDLTRPNNRFVRQRQKNMQQVNKTNIGLLLYDLKEELNENLLKVQLSDFNEGDISYSGYKLVLITPNKQEIEQTFKYFEQNNFENKELNDSKNILFKGKMICIIEEDVNNNLAINCGLPNL